MSILDALAKKNTLKDYRDCASDGMLYIYDAVYDAQLYRLGLSKEDRDDLMGGDPEGREWVLNYFERLRK